MTTVTSLPGSLRSAARAEILKTCEEKKVSGIRHFGESKLGSAREKSFAHRTPRFEGIGEGPLWFISTEGGDAGKYDNSHYFF